MEKIQHSVSGPRERSIQRAEKEDEEDGGEVGVSEGGKVTRVWAWGEECWCWRRRRRGRVCGRCGVRWGARVRRGVGWMWVRGSGRGDIGGCGEGGVGTLGVYRWRGLS